MKQAYVAKRFHDRVLEQIQVINEIIDDYQAQGFKLTVRQLYYQMVARDYIPNTLQSYGRLADTINNGRLAGLIDWDAIEDRTREFITRNHWNDPKQLVQAARDQWHMDLWEGQDVQPVIIVEKEALVNVFERVAHEYDVPLLAARGYPSVSVLREFAEYHIRQQNHKRFLILHFGDHDPSGIDMTRDLRDRLTLLSGESDLAIDRMALNMDQVRKQKPPPNPAKVTDSRFANYAQKFGDKSWELDALNPKYLADLARKGIESVIEDDTWQERRALIESERKKFDKALRIM